MSPEQGASARRSGTQRSSTRRAGDDVRVSTRRSTPSAGGNSTKKMAWKGPVAAVLVLLASMLVLLGLLDRPEPGDERFETGVLQADLNRARDDLAGLEVVEEWDPAPEYDRAEYMPSGWADFDGDCLDTRHEVLLSQSTVKPTMSDNGCDVEAGEWQDPYTGRRFTDPDQLDIDHVVALSAAHQAGAWRLSGEDRERLANDMSDRAVGLAVVETPVNQSKGDRGPEAWMPPATSAHCSYATRWITMKSRWELQTSPAEVDALTQALDSCQVTPDR